MVILARKKRVTDPLDDEAKARIVSGNRQFSDISSGSEHSGTGDDDSPCLSELVHDFLEDNGHECNSVGNDFDSEQVDSVTDCMDSVEELLNLSASTDLESYKSLLLLHSSEAAEKFAFLKKQNISSYRRNVMSFLREKGHNAAICKTRWDSSGGITAGNYEFIDVVQSGPSAWHKRYFVDLNFTAQFEIARPTSEYTEFLNYYVPKILVGTEEELKRTLRVLCGVVKRCFGKRGLSVPPWRKNRYMQNKWFGAYKRTLNPVQGNPVHMTVSAVSGAKCRFVGFDDDAVSEARGVTLRTR